MNLAGLCKSYALALFPSQFVAWIDAVSAFLDDTNVQRGVVTLTNGVSALVPADMTATTRVTFGMRTVSGAFGTPVVTQIVAGLATAGGGFVVSSSLPASGAVVTTDQGTYFWHAIG